MRLSSLQTSFALMSMILLAGCTSNKSMQLIEDYAKQTEQVQLSVLDAYSAYEEHRLEGTLMQAMFNGSSINDLKPVPIDYTGQKKALADLLVFAQSLQSLASDDIGEEVDKTSKEIGSALSDLAENEWIANLDDKDVTLITSAVNALARAYTEHARYTALKALMSASQPVVSATIDSIVKDLPSWKRITILAINDELTVLAYLVQSPETCIAKEVENCSVYHYSLEDRLEAYRRAYYLKVKRDQLDDQFRALESALMAIKEMHLAMDSAIQSDNKIHYDSLKRLLESSKKQVDAVKAFKSGLEE